MKKLLFMILILLITDLISFCYLRTLYLNRLDYHFEPHSKIFLCQKKDIILEEIDDFIFEEYFDVLSLRDYVYKYHFDKDRLYITIDDMTYTYPYEVKEKEVITVEKVIYQEVVREIEKPAAVSTQRKEEIIEYEVEEDYFRFLTEELSFEQGTDISLIISEIRNNVDTNQNVTIDYSQLNPNQIGQYSVFFITKEQKYAFSVKII